MRKNPSRQETLVAVFKGVKPTMKQIDVFNIPSLAVLWGDLAMGLSCCGFLSLGGRCDLWPSLVQRFLKKQS